MASELDSLNAQKRSLETQKAENEKAVSALNEQIDRLKEVKRKVSDIKDTVGTMKTTVKGKEEPDENWLGEKRRSYCDFASGSVRSDYKAYYDNTDDCLDEICDAITRLKNELSDYTAGISWLKNAINNIIEKLFN